MDADGQRELLISAIERDFCYCSTWSGIVYVAFTVDVFPRRLVAGGWHAP